MFARSLNVLVNGVWLAIAAVIALVVGSACTQDPDCQLSSGCGNYTWDRFAVVARGASVIPPAADTLANITARIVGTGGPVVNYTVGALPTGAAQIDSIFLYTVAVSTANYTVGATGATTYVAPSARVCGSSIGTETTGLAASLPPACAAGVDLTARPTVVTGAVNGYVTTNTDSSLTTSMRNFGQQLVVFTSGVPFAKRGSVRGTPYLAP